MNLLLGCTFDLLDRAAEEQAVVDVQSSLICIRELTDSGYRLTDLDVTEGLIFQ